jgi:hypothetical protein
VSLETDLVAAIELICPRVYPDIAPDNAALPYITWQHVGGGVINPLDNSAPNKRNHRIQINVWSKTRLEANEILNDIEDAIRAAPLNGRPVGALFARYEEMTRLRGAQQDFTFWR